MTGGDPGPSRRCSPTRWLPGSRRGPGSRYPIPGGILDQAVLDAQARWTSPTPDGFEARGQGEKATIEIRGLVKTFGKVRALDGLDLDVAPGEVHGFLGPNGAGKSTTIRVLLGLLRADAGRSGCSGATRGATRPAAPAAGLRARRRDLWPNLTGGEVIDLLGRLRGGLDAAPSAELLERFELDPTKKGRSLLQGQPAEGRAGRRAGRRRRAARPRRADLGAGPADGVGLPACVDEFRDRGARSCSPATSSPRSSGCATGSASSGPAGRSSPGRSTELRT